LPPAANFFEEETLTSSLQNLDTLDGGGSRTEDEFERIVARTAVAQALEATGFDCMHQSAINMLVDVVKAQMEE
jgi:hypothetical protein